MKTPDSDTTMTAMNVLVLQVPALQLGFLGAYGNAWIATPNIDRLAATGVVFDNHFADALDYPSYWTGQMKDQSPVLASAFEEAGVPFIRIAPAASLGAAWKSAIQACRRLAGQSRWLCWVDLPSLHPPWPLAVPDEAFTPLVDPALGPFDLSDEDFWDRLRLTYAEVVMELDEGIGTLWKAIDKLGLADDLTIIMTAQRGLALGEHGIIGDYFPWLHDEVVHIPLIIRQCAERDAGRRIGALTQSVDVAATLFDLFQMPPPRMDGSSWLPILASQATAIREYALSRWTLAGVCETSIRTLDWALLGAGEANARDARQLHLFAKPEDRWEVNNVIQHHQELAAELVAVKEAYFSKG
jgi:arylsulfatase A-like enzyme